MRSGIAGLLAGIMAIIVLFSLSGFQITSETAGTRLLGRLGAAMIELDRWAPAHQEDLDLLARDRPSGEVEVRDLPVAVRLPSSQLIAARADELEVALRRAMGRVLYDQGRDALQASAGEAANLGVDEPVRWTIALLESEMHGRWRIALALSLLLLVALGAAVLAKGHVPLGPIAAGAGLAAIGALGFWLLTYLLYPAFESAIDREIVLILRDGAWLGLRNSAAVALAATALLLILGRVVGKGPRRSEDDYAYDYEGSLREPDGPVA